MFYSGCCSCCYYIWLWLNLIYPEDYTQHSSIRKMKVDIHRSEIFRSTQSDLEWINSDCRVNAVDNVRKLGKLCEEQVRDCSNLLADSNTFLTLLNSSNWIERNIFDLWPSTFISRGELFYHAYMQLNIVHHFSLNNHSDNTNRTK